MANRKLFDFDTDRLACFNNSGGNASGRRHIYDLSHHSSINTEYRTFGSLGLCTANTLDGERNSLRLRAYHWGEDPTEFCRVKLGFVTNNGSPWLYLYESIDETQGGAAWQFDTFNRIRWAVYFPEGHPVPREDTRRYNSAFKTYLRHPEEATSTQNSAINWGEGEYPGQPYTYYRSNLIPGTWQFFHADDHFSYIVNHNDDFYSLNHPWSNSTEFTPRSDINWVDGSTFMFFHVDKEIPHENTPITADHSTWWAYSSHANEDSEWIFGATGAYHPGTTELAVSWSVERSTTYLVDVRYAYSDIRALGWANATAAPGGTGMSNPNSAYNLMEYRTTGGIPVGGNDFVYIAIKRQDRPDDMFYQIVLPLTAGGNPPLPEG